MYEWADSRITGVHVTYNGDDRVLVNVDSSVDLNTVSYSIDGSDWSTAGSGLPTARDAGEYIVQVRFVPTGETDPVTVTVIATIDPKQLTLTFTAQDKTYNGTRDAVVSNASLTGVENDDDVSVTSTAGTFSSANVGEWVVTPDFTLSGGDKDNYTVIPAEVKANINPATIVNVSVSGETVVYDGNPHTVTVTDPDAATDTILYSTNGTDYSGTCPAFTQVGSYTVYVKVQRENYSDWTGSANVVIEQRQGGPETPSMVVTTGEDVVDKYDGKISLREALTVYFQTDGTYRMVGDEIIYGKDTDNVTVTFNKDVNEISAIRSFDITPAQDGVKINGTNSPDQANHVSFSGNDFCVFEVFYGVNNAEFNNLIFSENTAVNGSAIYSHNYSNFALKVQKCEFSRNTAQEGGAIFVPQGSLTIADSIFTGNKATRVGGAVRAINADTIISGSTFTGNEAHDAAAVYSNDGTLTVAASTFTGNKATGGGAAIFAENSVTNVSGSKFSDNTAADGSAIFTNGGTLTVDASDFTGNKATGTSSGTIVSEGSTASINYSKINRLSVAGCRQYFVLGPRRRNLPL